MPGAAATRLVWEDGTTFAPRCCAIRTGRGDDGVRDFWELVRSLDSELATPDPRRLREEVIAMAASSPLVVDPTRAGLAVDVVISDLRTVDLPHGSPLRVTGVNGPLWHAPLPAVHFVGAAMTDGRLHLVKATGRPRSEFLDRLGAAQQAAALAIHNPTAQRPSR